ncbi:MAG: hypothetical protein SPG92_09610 [Sodaliphilus sp.]|nr:hypothetical protein [Sodaliphilus sp.]
MAYFSNRYAYTRAKNSYTAEAKIHFHGNAYCPDDLETLPLTK